MRNSLLLYLMLVAGLLGVLAGKSLLVSVPAVRSAAAPGEFDTGRAHTRLARILGDERPHPVDTAASDPVRNRLIAELRAAGLSPVVRDQFACNGSDKQRGVSCARVRNIVARIGPPDGKAILLSAHYDSTPTGPGAADAGIGVASLIEIASILRETPLQRPVIFLFNEGEEAGLIGARAFLADPLSRTVDSLVNLEARGVSGPANMFETSVPNAPAIKIFSRAVDRPVANSLATDVYRLLPNSTDVNTFAERGWLTLNLAIIGNETRYHSAGDNLAALSRPSLQHMGDQALALTRELAAGTPPPGGSRIFMDLLGRKLISLPTALGLALLELLLLAFAWFSWRRGGLGRGLATAVVALLLATALAWLLQWALGTLRGGMFWRAYPFWTHLAVHAAALLGSIVALRAIGERLTPRQLRPAFWLSFLLLGSLLALVAPGGAIYFIFPPLLILIGLGLRRYWRPAERIAGIAAVLLLFLTLGEMLALLEELLSRGLMWIFAPLSTLLLLPALIEGKALIASVPRAAAIGTAALLMLGAGVAAAAAPNRSEDRQARMSVEYVADLTAGRAQWSVLNDSARLPDALRRTGAWKLGTLPYTKTRRWLAGAPAPSEVTPPAMQLLSVAPGGKGERRIRVRLQLNGALGVTIVAPPDAAIRAAGAAAFVRPISRDSKGQYFLRCSGRSCDGAVMDIVIGKPAPVQALLVGTYPGLPASAAPLLAARPDHARPQYGPDQTITLQALKL